MTEAAYVDSNVFIPPVLREQSERVNGARTALERIEVRGFVAYTSGSQGQSPSRAIELDIKLEWLPRQGGSS